MANEKTYSVVLNDGSTAERRSARPYLAAIVVESTPAHAAAVCGPIAAEIARLEAAIAAAAPRAATQADADAYAVALARVAYLEEPVAGSARWLTDAFKTEAVGYSLTAEERKAYNAATRAWNDAGLTAIHAAGAALRATARGAIECAEGQLACQREFVARRTAQTAAGRCWVDGWSQSLANAHKAAAAAAKAHPGAKVYVLSGAAIKVHVPTPRKAKGAGVAPDAGA